MKDMIRLTDKHILAKEDGEWVIYAQGAGHNFPIILSEEISTMPANTNLSGYAIIIENQKDVVIPANFKCGDLSIYNCENVTIKDGLECDYFTIKNQTGKLKLPNPLVAHESVTFRNCDGLLSLKSNTVYKVTWISFHDCKNFKSIGDNVSMTKFDTPDQVSGLDIENCVNFSKIGKGNKIWNIGIDDSTKIKSFPYDIFVRHTHDLSDDEASVQLQLIRGKFLTEDDNLNEYLIYMLKYAIDNGLFKFKDDAINDMIMECEVDSSFDDISIEPHINRWGDIVTSYDSLFRIHKMLVDSDHIHPTDSKQRIEEIEKFRDELYDKLESHDVDWKSIKNIKKYFNKKEASDEIS